MIRHFQFSIRERFRNYNISTSNRMFGKNFFIAHYLSKKKKFGEIELNWIFNL